MSSHAVRSHLGLSAASLALLAASASGAEAQTTNFHTSARRCKSVRTLPASQLHAKLPGQATELECSQQNNNGAPNASRWMLLEAYGVAILVASKSGSRQLAVQVLDVQS